jgi:hypothetical protein
MPGGMRIHFIHLKMNRQKLCYAFIYQSILYYLYRIIYKCAYLPQARMKCWDDVKN